MKVLALNCGSSSIKCDLIEGDLIWKAHLQWKNQFEDPSLTINGQLEELSAQSLEEAFVSILERLDHVDVIGHRIVHGGEYFKKSVVIDHSVKEKIKSLSELAPMHNPPELEGIVIAEKIFPNTPQIAVFDTAFHHTLSEAASLYPGPYQWYEEGIRRFGFHGISCQYCVRRTKELLGQLPEKIIISHLGSGASLTAIHHGKSIDTTMGFTPLEGLMMDTRSGTIDPGIILHLLKTTSLSELSHTLFQRSGLLGISGVSSDMREMIENLDHPRSKLAFDLYIHTLNRFIGAMVASLQGLDALVFTAGIGENAPLVREGSCQNFSFLELKLDRTLNNQSGDRLISTPDSKVKVLVIHTRENQEIARECTRILGHR